MAEAFRLDTRKLHVFFTATPSYYRNSSRLLINFML